MKTPPMKIPTVSAGQTNAPSSALSGRLKLVREHLKLSQGAMARRIGRGLRGWQKYEAAETAPDAEALTQLHKIGVDLGWLLTGRGEMFRSVEHDSGAFEGLFKVPKYEFRAAAGGGAYVDHEEPVSFIAISVEWVRQKLRCRPEDLCIVEASGDSMFPTIQSGDPLLINRADRDFKDGATYVFRVGEAVHVKRVWRKLSGDVDLISDNPAYPTETLTPVEAEAVHIIGRVVWAMRIS